VTIAGSSVVVCLLPMFLVGSTAPLIGADLGLGPVGLGLAVALYRAAGAMSSPLLGRRVDRIGSTTSIRMAAVVAALASLGIAVTARTTPVLVGWLMLAGCSVALAQPAANRLLAGGIRAGGLGTAFGIKQSAPPLASTLAGVSVPLIAATVGWRWGFVAAAALAAVLAASLRPMSVRNRLRPVAPATARVADRPTIVVLAVAFGLGTSVSSAITTFFVVATVGRGTSGAAAATMLALAGLAAIAVRVLAGVVSDRVPGNHLRGCAWLVAIGAIGVGFLAGAQSVPLQAAAVTLALAGTWGFNGVFWYALIRAFPDSPGAITGAVSPGAMLGSTIGPLAFGLAADAVGYGGAFSALTVVALVTAAALTAGNARLRAVPDSAAIEDREPFEG
jgi:MFS family permease